MDKNFSIDNAVSIDADDYLCDLHNFYDFTEIRIEASTESVSILFTLNSQFEENGLMQKEVSIKFSGVEYFELSPNFVSKFTRNLEEIGYKNANDKDVDWLINEDKSEKTDHLFFRFETDEFIRIYSKMALCSVGS